jgi:hypothetical protein
MPTDACLFFYDCEGCGAPLKPKTETVASSAPMARFRARLFRRAARAVAVPQFQTESLASPTRRAAAAR